MKRRTINGHPIAFHLDSRLDKLKEKFDRLQTLQDDLLDISTSLAKSMIPEPPFSIGQHVRNSQEYGHDFGIVTGIQFHPAHWLSQEWVCSVWLYSKDVSDESIPACELTPIDTAPPDHAFDVFRTP